jgi:hypothetical protein
MPQNGSASSSTHNSSREETLTSGASLTCGPTTSVDTCSATSSPASAGGPTLFDLLDGQTIDGHGLVPAPANHSAASTSTAAAKPTCDTFGPSFTVSPASAFLQSSLESRLRVLMDLHGSPEFALTWKHQDMPSGPRIFRLAASARHRSGNGSGLWPWATPKASDGEKAGNLSFARRAAGRTADNLPGQMRAHWGVTVADGAPSPEHALWLMGYPPEFLSYAPSETPSTRKPLRRSSAQRLALSDCDCRSSARSPRRSRPGCGCAASDPMV